MKATSSVLRCDLKQPIRCREKVLFESIGICLTETSETTFNLNHPSSSRFTQLSTAQKITHNMCTESQSIQILFSRETPHF